MDYDWDKTQGQRLMREYRDHEALAQRIHRAPQWVNGIPNEHLFQKGERLFPKKEPHSVTRELRVFPYQPHLWVEPHIPCRCVVTRWR